MHGQQHSGLRWAFVASVGACQSAPRGEPASAPPPAAAALSAEVNVRRACRAASDCDAGQTCCRTFTTGYEEYACTPRSGPGSRCRVEVCVEDGAEQCAPGQVCRAGTCGPEQRVASCGAEGRCSGERPLCLWSAGQARCASRSDAESRPRDGTTSALGCSRASDCGAAARCCTNDVWDGAECRTHCDAANNAELCAADADCGGVRRCVPIDGDEGRALPPWARICEP